MRVTLVFERAQRELLWEFVTAYGPTLVIEKGGRVWATWRDAPVQMVKEAMEDLSRIVEIKIRETEKKDATVVLQTDPPECEGAGEG